MKIETLPPLLLTAQPAVSRQRHARLAIALGAGGVLALLEVLPLVLGLRADAHWLSVGLHTVLESLIVLLGVLSFTVAWHARRSDSPANVTLLACGLLAASLLDFAHVVTYDGMPNFITPAAHDKSLAFAVAARAVTAATLLAVAWLPWRPWARRGQARAVLLVTVLVTGALSAVWIVWPQRLPHLYDSAQGLTELKFALEWAIAAMLALAALRLWQVRGQSADFDIESLLLATALLGCTALCMSFYTQQQQLMSLAGHTAKLAALVVLYRAIYATSVQRPAQRLATEIALREMAQRQLRNLAYFDALTGLPNANHLKETLAGLLCGSARPQRVALLVVGLDGLEGVNDSYGHAFGDRVLRTLAERLAQRRDLPASAFRLDGSRFALVLDDAGQGSAVAAAAQALRLELSAPMFVLGMEIEVTASIGISIAPDDTRLGEELLRNASLALHNARARSGGACLAYEAAMSQRAIERFNLRAGIRRALDRGEFELHYQPQFDLHDGQVVGVEALLRWRLPSGETISPARFIPEAEDSGLIVPLGAWALREACRQAAAWRREGLHVPAVAVNMSARQFQAPDIERVVAEALREAQLPAEALELELTESVLLKDTEATLLALRRLKSLGLRLAIDDFGTGYSSLAYLRAFPIDKLKIDQAFVRELESESSSEVLVATIIRMASSLGMQTIAEGVADPLVAGVLLRLGCGQAQGYHFARPMTAADMGRFLRGCAEAEPQAAAARRAAR